MPITMRQHEATLQKPAFCELLPVRDFLDNVMVRTDGSFVAGYAIGGINSYYHSDDARNQTKYSLEALTRSLTERSMRMQVRFEVVEGLGDLPQHYKGQLRCDHNVVQTLDAIRLAAWREKEDVGFYLRPILRAFFVWNPRVHHESADSGIGDKLRRNTLSLSADKCIRRSRREHEDLLAEFESIMRGVEHTLTATGMAVQRLTEDVGLFSVRLCATTLRGPVFGPQRVAMLAAFLPQKIIERDRELPLREAGKPHSS